MMKTKLLLRRFAELCSAFPDSKCLLITRSKPVQVAHYLAEILDDVEHSCEVASGMITFSNGSRIALAHCREEKDSDPYLALEWDVIDVDGVELSDDRECALTTCIRSYGSDSRIPALCSEEMTAEGQKLTSLIERMLAIVKEVADEIAQNSGASS